MGPHDNKSDKELLVYISTKVDNMDETTKDAFKRGEDRMAKIETKVEKLEDYKAKQPVQCQTHELKIKQNEEAIKTIPSENRIVKKISVLLALFIAVATLILMFAPKSNGAALHIQVEQTDYIVLPFVLEQFDSLLSVEMTDSYDINGTVDGKIIYLFEDSQNRFNVNRKDQDGDISDLIEIVVHIFGVQL